MSASFVHIMLISAIRVLTFQISIGRPFLICSISTNAIHQPVVIIERDIVFGTIDVMLSSSVDLEIYQTSRRLAIIRS